MTPRVVLSIAGSDSGGGAGLQADLRTLSALGLHAATAVTAVTAQNTTAVAGVVALEPSFVVAQIEAVLEDMTVAAVKTGMLASAATVEAVGRLAAAGRLPRLVVDPVLVSATGHALLDEGGVAAYRRHLLPHALVATPNLKEAAVLTGRPLSALREVDAMAKAAEDLRSLGVTTVVVKGGHLEGDHSPDVLVGPEGTSVLRAARVATRNDHGTGCSLSAAVAARLALGDDVLDAVAAAKAFVRRGLLGAARWQLGAGRGPIDHLGWEDRQ